MEKAGPAESSSISTVYVDATFRVVPSLYHQLFTIFVPDAEYAFPACFALMIRKTTLLYEAVLRKINTMESQFQPTFSTPVFFMVPRFPVPRFQRPQTYAYTRAYGHIRFRLSSCDTALHSKQKRHAVSTSGLPVQFTVFTVT